MRRDRNIDVRQKHQLTSFSYMPQLGIELAPWVCALTRNWTHDLLVHMMLLHPTEPHQPGHGQGIFTMKNSLWIWKREVTFLSLHWKAEKLITSICMGFTWLSSPSKGLSMLPGPGQSPSWLSPGDGGFCSLQTSHLASGAISIALLRSYA